MRTDSVFPDRLGADEPIEAESDARNIRQRLMGLAEQLYNIRSELEGVADQFWGPILETAHSKGPEVPTLPGDNLNGIHAMIDELYDLTRRLGGVASRYRRLA